MQEVLIQDKQKYLDEHHLLGEVPKLTDKKRCIHCGAIFTVGDYKVFKDEDGDEFICCANAPECNGTVIDWFDVE